MLKKHVKLTENNNKNSFVNLKHFFQFFQFFRFFFFFFKFTGISTLTGNPGGNFISMKSRNFWKCLNWGAMTSRTFNSISTVSGKSSLMATVALKAREDSLHLEARPSTGCWPAGLWMYSDQVTSLLGGGLKDSFLLISPFCICCCCSKYCAFPKKIENCKGLDILKSAYLLVIEFESNLNFFYRFDAVLKLD